MEEASYRLFKETTRWQSFWNGLRYAGFVLQASCRYKFLSRKKFLLSLTLLITATLVPAATLGDKALLIASVLLLFLVDLLNSPAAIDAVEASKDPHLAKTVNDLGKIAASISTITCISVWILVLINIFLHQVTIYYS